ncbi:DNA helicase Pif1-like [Cinara cedri]|uniref:DNA helicase Pif1-like n=1 Tax=Cinara cedri TaxID=506608 RepID=A0A5E4MQS9_9HEMI|nr:DNA helicase Pif1-like [Cinara cedri]
MCNLMCGSLLVRLGMPAPDRGMNGAFNQKLEHEREDDRHKLNQLVQTNLPLMKPPKEEKSKNTDVDDLNFVIQNQIVGTLHSFKSNDCLTNEGEATNYPTKLLNFLDVPGLPPQNVQLKVG